MLAFLMGKTTDCQLRLFAVACCRRVWDRSDHWQEGIELAERYAEGHASRDEMLFRLGYLTRDFEEVIESDNGEIYAAKQAVLATLSVESPFDPSVAAAAASKSIGRSHDSEEAQQNEKACQADLLRATFNELTEL